MLGETREAEEWARGCVREGVMAVARVLSASKKDRRRLEQREARSAGGTSGVRLGRRGVSAGGEATLAPVGRGINAGVKVHGARNHRARPLGRRRYGGFPARGRNQTGYGGAHMEVTPGFTQGEVQLFLSQNRANLYCGQKSLNTKVIDKGPGYNFPIGTFL